MEIRDATPGDHGAIDALLHAAFDPGDDEAAIWAALHRNGEIALELVAICDRQVTGHLVISPMISPQSTLGLGPMAVAPEHQRQGIGSALVNAALDRLRGRDWAGLFVLGAPAYYERFGFETRTAEPHPSLYEPRYFHALDLGGLASLSGPARYARGFGEPEPDRGD